MSFIIVIFRINIKSEFILYNVTKIQFLACSYSWCGQTPHGLTGASVRSPLIRELADETL
jgi:hypothetical protein